MQLEKLDTLYQTNQTEKQDHLTIKSFKIYAATAAFSAEYLMDQTRKNKQKHTFQLGGTKQNIIT